MQSVGRRSNSTWCKFAQCMHLPHRYGRETPTHGSKRGMRVSGTSRRKRKTRRQPAKQLKSARAHLGVCTSNELCSTPKAELAKNFKFTSLSSQVNHFDFSQVNSFVVLYLARDRLAFAFSSCVVTTLGGRGGVGCGAFSST